MSSASFALGALLALAPLMAIAAPQPATEAVARAFVGELAKGDFAAAAGRFDAAMAAALPAEKLKATWVQVTGQVGAFGSIESLVVKPMGMVSVALLTCKFAKSNLVLKVAVDAQGRVGGFFILPPESEVPWHAPAYARAEALEERPVQVGSNPALPGILTVPKGAGPFPAVVLVHGSGPEDADESIGGAKVFKDLAWGLAGKGVATLRYVKRSKQDPRGLKTVKEEVLDGAVAAVALLKSTPGIDPKRIVILGHSQGGYLAPRIAKASSGVAGLVLLAGSSRPEQELWVEQVQYLSSLEPGRPDLKKLLVDTRAAKVMVEDPKLDPAATITLPFGGSIPGAYLLDLRGYQPTALAVSLGLPVLVLQGGRDYQVTHADFEGWKAALTPGGKATFHQYPALNHLFVAGEGPPGPTEYARPGHVDPAVITDLASWVLALPR